jgi:ParB family chromosome partitioning protein
MPEPTVSKKSVLGRGIGALLPTNPPVTETVMNEQATVINGVSELDINIIEPNRDQPRKHFDAEAIDELAKSITEVGIIQPIIVSDNGNGFYTIIAGERRWRAARVAKLTHIPAIVRDYSEGQKLQVALIENIQRRDLNPIEEAKCYKRLMDDFFFTQEDIAKQIGKSRNIVSYYISLLTLDARVQNYLEDMELTVAHGRLLLNLGEDEQYSWAKKAVDSDWGIRMLEAQLKASEKPKAEEEKKPVDRTVFTGIEKDLMTVFGTKVAIHDKDKKGKIEIEYYSHEELERIIEIIKS